MNFKLLKCTVQCRYQYLHSYIPSDLVTQPSNNLLHAFIKPWKFRSLVTDVLPFGAKLNKLKHHTMNWSHCIFVLIHSKSLGARYHSKVSFYWLQNSYQILSQNACFKKKTHTLERYINFKNSSGLLFVQKDLYTLASTKQLILLSNKNLLLRRSLEIVKNTA